jgi:putative transcriptional regulator
VPERLNGTDSKSVVRASVPGVRIPPSPPDLNELSEKVDLTLANLSILKTGKAKAVRFSTLEAICKALNCQPGDILEFVE